MRVDDKLNCLIKKKMRCGLHSISVDMPMDCAGCGKVIEDRFALEVIGRHFHHSCLKCACCNAQLAELSRICYHRDLLLLCLRDYMRLYGQSGVCARCSLIIKPMEYVMHAKTYVFHLSCFACVRCNERFCVGDSYYLYGTDIYCPTDYKALIVSLRSQNNLNVVDEEASTSVSDSDSETHS
ncbi:hypothetical protein M3Y94_00088200 [Aphelenchoides besseyi]|nr:hypothetical protein M3Y94_00088200 [Aphelenchoides besseyi]